jgi:hypothetical protein
MTELKKLTEEVHPRIVNLIGRRIFLLNEKHEVLRQWDPAPLKSRVSIHFQVFEGLGKTTTIDDIPINYKLMSCSCPNLPDVQNGIFYIVSPSIARALKRSDLLAPGYSICGEEGSIEEGDVSSCYSFDHFVLKG